MSDNPGGGQYQPQIPQNWSHINTTNASADASTMQSPSSSRKPNASMRGSMKRRKIKFSCDDGESDSEDRNFNPQEEIHEETSSQLSDESFTLRDRQDAINSSHPFGIRIWKPAIYKKSRSVVRDADQDIRATSATGYRYIPLSVKIGNFLYSATFGLILWASCFLAALVILFIGLCVPSCKVYGRFIREVGWYFLWPFGKYVKLEFKDDYRFEDEGLGRSIADYFEWQSNHQGESQPLFFAPQRRRRLSENFDVDRRRRLFGRGKWTFGRVLFYTWFWLCLTPLAYTISVFCWFGVVTVPMARVLVHIVRHLRAHPLALSFNPVSEFSEQELENADRFSIILCTFRAGGLKYYKYTVDGTNVIILNMMATVVFTIVDFYFLHITSETFRFVLSLVAVIPLAHYIGQAVASISAQSSMTMGATINAFFSTIVEVFLYLIALKQGKGQLVEGSIIGSVMAGTILLPGLSMCAGALKRKTQRFNPQSTGATSTMLLFSVVGVFSPSMWYLVYGPKIIECDSSCFAPKESISSPLLGCRCWEGQAALHAKDSIYTDLIRPFAIVCAIGLAVGYIIGLLFTLRTHASLIWATGSEIHDDDEESGHDVPNWGRKKSYVILLSATWMYAVIAEVLVDSVDVVLRNVNITQKMVGITIFALVPNTTEFLNAISFSINGNVSLSLEIGSAYALQVCLLQIPALVLWSLRYSNLATGNLKHYVFTLVFPQWDLWTAIICVFLYTNVHTEGKSNYFKGGVLILSYIVLVCGFYFLNDEVESNKQDPASISGVAAQLVMNNLLKQV